MLLPHTMYMQMGDDGDYTEVTQTVTLRAAFPFIMRDSSSLRKNKGGSSSAGGWVGLRPWLAPSTR
jgi:hypothetical protein